MTIRALASKVLHHIFNLYRAATIDGLGAAGLWNMLVRVCQRWRYIVFASPLRLDLCLRRTSETPVGETLDSWPIDIELLQPDDEDNVIATLGHRDRIGKIWILGLTSSQLERLAPMMQEPFPVLTFLQLDADETSLVLPDMFLGGSAPRLQTLKLRRIPFPGLPRLLLSATDLSELFLMKIPHTGYISPEAMATVLSALTRLTYLVIEFESPASRPDRRPPPLTRVILPALKKLQFRGVSEYLEDLVSWIDAPRLDSLQISFFNQIIFDIQQLSHFVGNAGILEPPSHAKVIFANDHVEINLYSSKGTDPPKTLKLEVYCRVVDWQVWSMSQICNQISFLPSIVEQLDIQVGHTHQETAWQVDMECTEWLKLFSPFTAARTVRISRELQPLIVPALQELTRERATEVFPALDSLYLEEYPPFESDQQAVEPFIAARQYTDHPITVHLWVKSESK